MHEQTPKPHRLLRFTFNLLHVLNVINLINHFIFLKCQLKLAKTKKNQFNSTFGNISYKTKGSGSPLLLVHDLRLGESHKEWSELVDLLSSHYKVYAIDLLGFGASSKPSLSYSSYLYAKLISEFVSTVIGKKTYAAASGFSSSFVMAAHKLNPDLFEKIILITPPNFKHTRGLPINRDYWTRILFESPIIGTVLYNFFASKYNIKKSLRQQMYRKTPDKKLVDRYHNDAHIDIRCKLPYASLRSRYLNVDIFRYLDPEPGGIPVHIIWGEKNTVNTLRNLYDFSQTNRNVSYTVFEKTKGLPHIENPYLFYKTCFKFFR